MSLTGGLFVLKTCLRNFMFLCMLQWFNKLFVINMYTHTRASILTISKFPFNLFCLSTGLLKYVLRSFLWVVYRLGVCQYMYVLRAGCLGGQGNKCKVALKRYQIYSKFKFKWNIKRETKKENWTLICFQLFICFLLRKKVFFVVVVVFYKLFDLDEENFIDEIQYIIYSSCKKLRKLTIKQTNKFYSLVLFLLHFLCFACVEIECA